MKVELERKPLKNELLAYAELMVELHTMRKQFKEDLLKLDLIPKGWESVEKDNPTRRKKGRITASFDADMLKWFRNMGHGYQSRMNAVLRIYMNAIIAKEVERKNGVDWYSDIL